MLNIKSFSNIKQLIFIQERLQAARQAVADLKKQNNAFQERTQNLTHEVEDAEVRKSELENQLKNLQQVCCLRFLNKNINLYLTHLFYG